MNICKAHILVVDSNGIHTNDFMDVIEYDGKFWLVPDWLDNSDRTMSRPTRIVSMEKLRHSRTPGANPEFVVEDPIPKFVFDGQIPPEQAGMYVVVEYPGILNPISRLH